MKRYYFNLFGYRFFLSLMILSPLCAVAPSRGAAEQESCGPALTEIRVPQSLSDRAEAVLFGLRKFPSSDVLKELVKTQDKALLDTVRRDIEAIRPCCEMLRVLPPTQGKKLVLLADAVLWQGQWLYGMYLGEFGIEVEAPFDVGMSELSKSAAILKSVMRGDTEVSREVEDVLRGLVCLAGGERMLDYPASLYDEQMSEDYKTALQFYKDFCAAVSAEHEAQVISLLKEQEPVLAYFTAKGEGEIWRVNRLALDFRAALKDLRLAGKEPYPQLAVGNRPPSVMKALQPFFAAFPALKELLQP